MPDKKISELIDGGAVQPTDLLVIARGTENRKVSVDSLLSSVSGGATFIELTQGELINKINNNELIKGGYYCITDYQCVNHLTNDLDPGLVNVGPVEPLVVLAIGTDKVSKQAISLLYPDDVIEYDATAIQMDAKLKAQYSGGTNHEFVNISILNEQTFSLDKTPVNYQTDFYMSLQVGNPKTGFLVPFTEYSHNDYGTKFTISGNQLTFIDPNHAYLITGGTTVSITVISNFKILENVKGVINSRENLTNNVRLPYDFRSYRVRRYEFDLTSIDSEIGIDKLGWAPQITIGKDEHTFNTTGAYKDMLTINMNNYDVRNLIVDKIKYFPIYNFVIKGSCIGVKIENNFYNNTLFGDFENVTFGSNCMENIIVNDISCNKVGHWFKGNLIKSQIKDNHILNYCQYNEFGKLFERNTIGNKFNHNKLVNVFIDNQIKDDFNSNTITYSNKCFFGNRFTQNVIQATFNNQFGDDCSNNNLTCSQFHDNNIESNFKNNTIISNDFFYNWIKSNFMNNTINSPLFKENSIGYYFYNNVLSQNVYNNVFGDRFMSNSLLSGEITGSVFGTNCSNNQLSSNYNGNIVGNFFSDNVINNAFSANEIGNNFSQNQINGLFQLNKIDSGFNLNTIAGNFNYNNIKNGFGSNNCNGNFGGNQINNGFLGNTLGLFENNVIENNFNSNQITGTFTYNKIGQEFNSNQINANFKNNIVDTEFKENIFNIDANYNVFRCFFKQNTIGDSLVSIIQRAIFECDFQSIVIATGPLFDTEYTKHVEKRETSGHTIWYFDNLNVMQVVGV